MGELGTRHIPSGSLLVMDQLSSYKNHDALETLSEAGTLSQHLLPKGSILLSPLDKEFFGVFKRKLQLEMEIRSGDITLLHFKASFKAYYPISVTIVNLFNKCGLIGSNILKSIKSGQLVSSVFLGQNLSIITS